MSPYPVVVEKNGGDCIKTAQNSKSKPPEIAKHPLLTVYPFDYPNYF